MDDDAKRLLGLIEKVVENNRTLAANVTKLGERVAELEGRVRAVESKKKGARRG